MAKRLYVRGTMLDRIMARVQERPGPMQTPCWIWTGSIRDGGYGQIAVKNHDTGKIAPDRVHRQMWIAKNQSIPDGLFVLHKCDVPACCNPEHLFVGTAGDNIRDCVSKGRNGAVTKPHRIPRGDQNGRRKHPESYGVGEEHPMAKLSEAQVREIRSRVGTATYVQLGREYGMDPSQIRNIAIRKHWRNVA